ncbi:MAG TPA: DUF3387 domain-containing protein, partial [bacterium]|nr:DUF3387 domain-containing protein [bacterium]
KYLPPEYSEVVMSFKIDEKEPINSFYYEWKKRYSGFANDKERIKKIIDDFKEKEYPKILIVTDMLITGFDAPILHVLYLDKLLKKHRLLQTIARTNRPYGDVKECGFIIDYAGVIKNLKYALKEYYKSEIKGLITEYDKLFEEFEKCIENMKEIFKNIKFKIEREVLLKSLDILRDDKIRDRFFENYKKTRKIFEILASHPEKLKYLKEFKWFSAVYDYYRKLTEDEEEKELVDKFFKKTVDFVHKNLKVKEIKKTLPSLKLDLKTIEEIRKSAIPEKEKVVNIIFILSKLVYVERGKNPVYRTIADRIDDLIRKWKERKIEIEELFKEEKEILKEIEIKEKEKEKLEFDNFDYGLYLILKDEIKEDEITLKNYVEEIKNGIKDSMVENWIENPALRQVIERKTREICLEIKNKHNLDYEKFDLLHRKIIEFVKEYGS